RYPTVDKVPEGVGLGVGAATAASSTTATTSSLASSGGVRFAAAVDKAVKDVEDGVLPPGAALANIESAATAERRAKAQARGDSTTSIGTSVAGSLWGGLPVYKAGDDEESRRLLEKDVVEMDAGAQRRIDGDKRVSPIRHGTGDTFATHHSAVTDTFGDRHSPEPVEEGT
ncbi:hypothetical protein HK101_007887, partial [Irineochytrium annulatum]